jgi:hypothetical protein
MSVLNKIIYERSNDMIDKPSSKCKIFGNEYLTAGQIRRLLLVEEERQFLFYPLRFWFYAL